MNGKYPSKGNKAIDTAKKLLQKSLVGGIVAIKSKPKKIAQKVR
tara:strand:- start:2536 stop:2667 length:132 start_codon:yes stop_codon:yes gene_type:complete